MVLGDFAFQYSFMSSVKNKLTNYLIDLRISAGDAIESILFFTISYQP